jgi:RNA polymerase sigma-70 factor (ECF subfamily)
MCEDERLVKLFLAGDQEAFNALYYKHKAKVFKLAINIVRNPTDCEDVVQEIFIQLFTKLHAFEFKCKFSSWLYRMSVNMCLMKLRSYKRKPATPFSELSLKEQESVLSSLISPDCLSEVNHELREVLEAAVNGLPKHYAAVFILKDVDQLTIPEISKHLSITPSILKNRLHTARQKLKKNLQEYIDILDEAA